MQAPETRIPVVGTATGLASTNPCEHAWNSGGGGHANYSSSAVSGPIGREQHM